MEKDTEKPTSQTSAYRPSTSRRSRATFAEADPTDNLAQALSGIKSAPEAPQELAVRSAPSAEIAVCNPGASALATAHAPSFLRVYSPGRLAKMTTTTPRQVLALCRTSEVGTIRTFCGEDEARTKAVMRLHLVNLNATCDVKKPLTEAQIEFIIDTITHDWQLKGLTLVDFMVVMRRAATGEYGEMFESLSPPKVLGWLKKYADERATVAGEMSREENEGYKGDASRSRYNKEQAAKSEEEGHHRAMLQALQERVRKQQKNKE